MKILIVDDDPGNRVIARRMLERHGGVEAMHIVDSGAACLETAAKVLFDTILLDISMPDMDGVTVCQKACEREDIQALPTLYDLFRLPLRFETC
jgi:two-component system sensor histidine kinase BarA